eukprot:scaffold47222_cov72-Phaeocystis_antarctica.AAC.5
MTGAGRPAAERTPPDAGCCACGGGGGGERKGCGGDGEGKCGLRPSHGARVYSGTFPPGCITFLMQPDQGFDFWSAVAP